MAWEGFAELVDKGDVLYLADGAVRLRVDEVDDGDVVTKVEVGGSVASRQGLNLPNVTVSLPAVSEEDIGADRRRARDGAWTSSRSRSCAAARTSTRCASTCAARGVEVPLIAKIEKPQAAANGEEIIDARRRRS